MQLVTDGLKIHPSVLTGDEGEGHLSGGVQSNVAGGSDASHNVHISGSGQVVAARVHAGGGQDGGDGQGQDNEDVTEHVDWVLMFCGAQSSWNLITLTTRGPFYTGKENSKQQR